MHILIFTSSPNKDGLTFSCAQALRDGILEGGGTCEIVCLNDRKVGNCQACDRGWGTCLTEHVCQILDDFQSIHNQVIMADGYAFVTPVYWGDMSESAKAFTDRLRRCEATLRRESRMVDKPVVVVAAAGGSGNGTISCLQNFERWVQHVQARIYEMVPVNRWSKETRLAGLLMTGKRLAIEKKQFWE